MQTPKRKPNPYDLIPQDYYMTPEAIQGLKDELEKLKKHIQPKLIKMMQAAAEHGDFSENHAYQQAKWKLRGVNGRMEKLKNRINKAILIDTSPTKDGIVRIGSKIKVEVKGNEKEYQILGSQEVDLEKNIISHLSPLGSILIGSKKGDKISLEVNDNIVEYEIINVI